MDRTNIMQVRDDSRSFEDHRLIQETILKIQKGLASFDRGEGIPADEALERLRQKYNIPRRQ
jgi:predicted transcriptional regulator